MRAFVKTNGGSFPNLNFYMAWEGFNQMGYSVTLFEEKDIETLDITKDTPVFAGVTVFRKVIDKLGVNYPHFDCYPIVLNPYYGRTLTKATLGTVKWMFHKDGQRVFVKPVMPKVFTGVVLDSLLNLIPLAAVPDDTEVYVCSPMVIESEYRVYVHDGDIIGVKHYHGDWSITPQKEFIKEVVKHYKPSPIAYGIDIAVVHDSQTRFHRDVVLEVNDGCNLGNYGVDSIHYGEMIVSRWFEIMAEHNVNKEIDDRITYAKELKEKYPDSSYFQKSVEREKNTYFKPNDWDGKCHKDYMVEDTMKELKAKSMKAFADEVMARLKENESYVEPTDKPKG